MRILWVKTDFLHPTTKGGHIRTLEILKRLHARHEIHYVAFDESGDPEGPRRSAEYCTRAYPVRHVLPRKDSPAFLGQLAAGLVAPVPGTIRRCRSAAMRRRIQRLLAEHSFDRLVCDFLAPAANIPRLSDWVLFQHNVESAIWRRHAEHARDPVRRAYLRLQATRMRAYEERVCREAGEIIAVSRQDASTMRRWYRVSRVAVVPTGVDVDYFSGPSPVPRVADLVFVGSMDWLPNVDGVTWFVREVLPRLRNRHPDCTVAIVGRSPDRAVPGPGGRGGGRPAAQGAGVCRSATGPRSGRGPVGALSRMIRSMAVTASAHENPAALSCARRASDAIRSSSCTSPATASIRARASPRGTRNPALSQTFPTAATS